MKYLPFNQSHLKDEGKYIYHRSNFLKHNFIKYQCFNRHDAYGVIISRMFKKHMHNDIWIDW
jgi:hypothetical protein